MKKLLIVLLVLFSFNSFALIVKSQTEFAATTTSALALAGDVNRSFLIIQNRDATNSILIKFKSAHTGTEGILLTAGEKITINPAPINNVYIRTVALTATVDIVDLGEI